MGIIDKIGSLFSVESRHKGRPGIEEEVSSPDSEGEDGDGIEMPWDPDYILDVGGGHGDARKYRRVLRKMGLNANHWWDIPSDSRESISLAVFSALENHPQNPGMVRQDLMRAKRDYERAVEVMKEREPPGSRKSRNNHPSKIKAELDQIFRGIQPPLSTMDILQSLGGMMGTVLPSGIWHQTLTNEERNQVGSLTDEAVDMYSNGHYHTSKDLLEEAVRLFNKFAAAPQLSVPAGPTGPTGPPGTYTLSNKHEIEETEVEKLTAELSALDDDDREFFLEVVQKVFGRFGIHLTWSMKSEPEDETVEEPIADSLEPEIQEKQGSLF